ncbi:hypothetical protein CHH83_02695 [Bacillus sp. 7586-K]|nr:hypothetical protein CHH83_02695 [Bacillus sp. 7586-K]
MNELDFSPLKDTIDGMAIKFGIFGLTLIIIGIFLKFILIKMRLPNNIANVITIIVVILVAFNYLTRIFEL